MGLLSALWDFAIEQLGIELDADPTHSSDLVKMKWSQFDGEFIEVRQQKTGERRAWPIPSWSARKVHP
jgi:hypothetical protein